MEYNKRLKNSVWEYFDFLSGVDPYTLSREIRLIMPPRRVLHTLGVEERAVTMAHRFGSCDTEARQAALLHDITKSFPSQLKLLQMCDMLCEGRLLPAVLHAVTGAELSKRLGASDSVISAVRWHTTGRENMTKLEKIIYLADMIEPFRKEFPGKKKLGMLCLDDLDKALHLGLTIALSHVESKGLEVDPNTVRALSWITGRLQGHE
ncbi:MAG: bis(5'-nucleosyl)-tetraphosphatase (symmetrical) YqeK [Oscillospiraceae bacterium]|nr:bis(5'-nucleosyl)-tetraphosphatase (symmetrical) YqeK [Oscillospiraceae bacterium]